MSSVRLLVVVSLICSASAFAQTQNDRLMTLSFQVGPSATHKPPIQFRIDELSDPFLVQNNTEHAKRLLEPFMVTRNEEITLKTDGDSRIVIAGSRIDVPGQPEDSLCYAIRSYVVARDSKTSDSVHPVGYTTCVPANRYQLRTTVERQTSER